MMNFESAKATVWWKIAAIQAAFLITGVIVWEWVSINKVIDPLFIGQPTLILAYLKGDILNGVILREATWTLGATLLAFGLGAFAGILVGLIFVMWPTAERVSEPIFFGLNSLPRIALAPLFLLWFGLGIASKVALGFSLTFFIVLANTTAGARSVDRDFLILSSTLGASKRTIFFRVMLPSAIPTIFSGLKLGMIYALLGVIGGEIIASQHGLGQLITYYAGTFNTNAIFGILLVLALLGVGIMNGMSYIEKHLLRWK